MTSTAPTTLRPLSHIELYSSSRHQIGLYRAVVVTCRYALSSLSEDRLFAALAVVVAAQPMLRVGIVGSDTSTAAFTHVERIDLRAQVDLRGVLDSPASPEEYETALAEIQGWRHNQRWAEQETRPPWQVIAVQPRPGLFETPHVDLVFGFHHAIADGTSGRLFHENLLAALNHPPAQTSPEPHLLSFPEPPVLPSAQQDVIDYTFSMPFMARVLWGALGPRWLQLPKQRIWHGQNMSLARPYVTRVIPVDVDAQVLASLLKACKAHSTSLTGLIHALALASLTSRLPDAPAFASSTPISMRPYLNASADPSQRDALCVLISSTTHHFSPAVTASLRDPTDLDAAVWSAAKLVKDDLTERAASLPANDPVGLMKHVSDWFKYWRSKDGQPRTESWEVSNVGVLKNPSGQDVAITRTMFSNGAMAAGPVIGIAAASVAGGTLTVTVSWQEGAVEEHIVSWLARDLKDFMMRFHTTQTFQYNKPSAVDSETA